MVSRGNLVGSIDFACQVVVRVSAQSAVIPLQGPDDGIGSSIRGNDWHWGAHLERAFGNRAGAELPIGQLKHLEHVLHAKDVNVSVPVGRFIPKSTDRLARNRAPDRAYQFLRNLTIAARVVPAHGIAVEQVNRSLFTTGNGKVRIRPGLIGQNRHSSRAQVPVVLVELGLIVRGKIPSYCQDSSHRVRGEFDFRYAVVESSRVGVESSISRAEVNVAFLIRRKSGAIFPDSAPRAVGRGNKNARLLQSSRRSTVP